MLKYFVNCKMKAWNRRNSVIFLALLCLLYWVASWFDVQHKYLATTINTSFDSDKLDIAKRSSTVGPTQAGKISESEQEFSTVAASYDEENSDIANLESEPWTQHLKSSPYCQNVSKIYNICIADPNLDESILFSDLDPQHCEARSKLGFMKTHKTASSTLQSIIYRYGYRHRLRMAVPKLGHQLASKNFSMRDLSRLAGGKSILPDGGFDMTGLHARWQQEAFSAMLGDSEDSVFITILRNPADAFKSMYTFQYFRLKHYTGMQMDNYIESLKTTANLSVTRYRNEFLGLNQQLWDLGLDAPDLYNEDKIKEKIRDLDSAFHLVLISDLMEESLVLLAHLMCWPLFWVSGFSKNISRKKSPLSEEHRSILQKHQPGDEMLYGHFRAKLERRIEEFGRSQMAASIDRLRKINNHFRDHCSRAPHVSMHRMEKQLKRLVHEDPSGIGFPECGLRLLGELDMVIFTRMVLYERLRREKNGQKPSNVNKHLAKVTAAIERVSGHIF